MSEQSKPKEGVVTRFTRKLAPLLLSIPIFTAPHRDVSPKPVENDPTRAGLPAQTTPEPASLPRNTEGIVHVEMPPMLPVGWQEDPRYANDRFTVTWEGGQTQELSRALLADQHVVLIPVGEDANGETLYTWHYYDPEHPPVPPQQVLPNEVRQALSTEVPPTPPVAESVSTPDLPTAEGYIPVMDMEVQTINGEQYVRFFMKHPDLPEGEGSFIIQVPIDAVMYSDGKPAAYESYRDRHPSIQSVENIPSAEDAQNPMRPVISLDQAVIFNG